MKFRKTLLQAIFFVVVLGWISFLLDYGMELQSGAPRSRVVDIIVITSSSVWAILLVRKYS